MLADTSQLWNHPERPKAWMVTAGEWTCRNGLGLGVTGPFQRRFLLVRRVRNLNRQLFSLASRNSKHDLHDPCAQLALNQIASRDEQPGFLVFCLILGNASLGQRTTNDIMVSCKRPCANALASSRSLRSCAIQATEFSQLLKPAFAACSYRFLNIARDNCQSFAFADKKARRKRFFSSFSRSVRTADQSSMMSGYPA